MSNFPFVSIIVPVCNEEEHIAGTLNSIQEQDYPANRFELLVVDGNSTDNTREIVHHFATNHARFDIRILDNPDKIVPISLNIAIRQAKGEIIIRVDGHTIIAKDYVRQCVQALQESGAENVGGCMNAVGANPFGEVVAIATSTPFGIGGGHFHYSDQDEWVDTVYMGAWPKNVFQKTGLFDEELVRDQDDEFNYRLRERGGKIFLSQKIKSVYTVRSNPKALWRQYYQYGFWKVRVLQKHPRQMSLRQFVPPVFVLALILSFIFIFFPFCRPYSPIVLLSYFVANVSASVISCSKKGWKIFPLMPMVFAILHLSYGLGFINGLIKFWNRWNDKVGQVPNLSYDPGR
jgi:succinoglycan biosynthesis protein ExoA